MRTRTHQANKLPFNLMTRLAFKINHLYRLLILINRHNQLKSDWFSLFLAQIRRIYRIIQILISTQTLLNLPEPISHMKILN